MNYVIGSGPAGIACASALLARGDSVTMLDAGQTLEPETRAALAVVGEQERPQWDPAVLAGWRRMGRAGGSPRKLSYGSDFAYGQSAGWSEGNGCDFVPSFAQGGLSNVWGAAILPFRQTDMAGWPLTRNQLAPYYAKVLEFVPMSARIDGLAADFPLYTDQFQEHKASSQAESLLAALERHDEVLSADGISFGKSRLAVRAQSEAGPDCVYCGMCMYGCPYGLIYNSAQTLAGLGRDPNFTYKNGLLVEEISETADSVSVLARETETGDIVTHEGERVFLGCGPVPTTQLLMKTLGLERSIFRDSQYFLVPVIQVRGGRGADEDLHTLAQVFIEIDDPDISEHTVHLQVYTYNDYYEQELRRRFGRLADILPSGHVLRRLLVIQGFLHSDDSVRVRVQREGDRFDLQPGNGRRARRTVGRVVRKLVRQSARLGVIPLLPLATVEAPGKSFHSGGTFPMQREPEPGASDILGRPAGLRRIHAIDSTVFPSIPATTITLTIMANAYRIGSECDTMDE